MTKFRPDPVIEFAYRLKDVAFSEDIAAWLEADYSKNRLFYTDIVIKMIRVYVATNPNAKPMDLKTWLVCYAETKGLDFKR